MLRRLYPAARASSGALICSASLLAASGASATLIGDGFVSGAGRYAATALNNQNPYVPGFTSGWTLGTGSTQFHVDNLSNSGLTSPGITYPTGGSVGITGTPTDASQTISRAVSVPSATTYYSSGIYLRGNSSSITPGAYAFMGWGNSVLPDAAASASTLQGVYVGFVQTAATSSGGTADDFGSLVIRTRQNISGVERTVDTVIADGQARSTYLVNEFVVTKLQVNSGGATDTLTYWLNPTSLTSDATMNATSQLFGSVTVDTIASSADLSRLTFAESKYDALFSFDEPRIATSLAELSAATPTPEPASLGLLVCGAAVLVGRRRTAR